ncbi:MAG: ExbD/TolR family protein [Pseudomonadota bacterium]
MPGVVQRGRGRRTMNEINMVPFIDVMLVLLIIFMVTAPLITPSQIDLPSVARTKPKDQQVLQVIIGKTGALELKDKDKTVSVGIDDIVARAKQAQEGAAEGSTAVVIGADKSVTYEKVVEVMSALQKAGVQRVGLLVQQAK